MQNIVILIKSVFNEKKIVIIIIMKSFQKILIEIIYKCYIMKNRDI